MFIDTHIDTLWAMRKQKRIFSERSDIGHVDLPRAQEADLLAGFFTGFPTDSQYSTESMLGHWIRMINNPANRMIKITRVEQLRQLEKERTNQKIHDRNIGVISTLEGLAGIDSGLNRLYIYYEMGLRAAGLTWNEENQFATGQAQGESRGLTKEGFDLISAMEDLGIIIDVSHLNDKSFWDVVNNTNQPIFASHSNLREIANHKRNLTEEMAQAISDSNGSIGVNFYNGFINSNIDNACRNDVLNMFDKLIELVGPKHVHIGADMDGAHFPNGIDDITFLPSLLEEVFKNNSLNSQEKESINKENVIRIMNAIWKK